MEIKFTLKELLEIKPSVEKIVNQDIDIVQSFKLAKFIKQLNTHYKDYDELRLSLIKKFGERNEEKGTYEVKHNVEEFKREIDKLLMVEVEVYFEPFNLEDFNGVKISSGDAIFLEKIFK